MTRIDFYLLADQRDLNTTIGRQVNTIGSHGVHIHAPDTLTVDKINRELQARHHESEHSALTIDCQGNPDGRQHTLINLCHAVLPFFSRFERLVEIIPPDEHYRTLARERYRYYKQRGYPLRHRQLGTVHTN